MRSTHVPYIARDSHPQRTTPDEIRFLHQGRVVVVFKRRVHQWRTDLMLRLDGRETYLARLEGGMTRGEVKQIARRKLDPCGDAVMTRARIVSACTLGISGRSSSDASRASFSGSAEYLVVGLRQLVQRSPGGREIY